MKQHSIKIPDVVEYRVISTGGLCFQPQYKKKSLFKTKWINFTYTYYDSRECDSCECNKTFITLNEANDFIDKHINDKEVVIHYRTND